MIDFLKRYNIKLNAFALRVGYSQQLFHYKIKKGGIEADAKLRGAVLKELKEMSEDLKGVIAAEEGKPYG